MILAELIARRRAHRILIVTPDGPLMRQWDAEMRERFGLRFTVIDRDRLTQIRFEQELGANPFDHVALGLISIDFAKQESVLQHLERTASIPSRGWRHIRLASVRRSSTHSCDSSRSTDSTFRSSCRSAPTTPVARSPGRLRRQGHADRDLRHTGTNLRRDRAIRSKLSQGSAAWVIVELGHGDLKQPESVLARIEAARTKGATHGPG